MRRLLCALVGIVACVTFWSPAARAGDYDFQLYRLGNPVDPGSDPNNGLRYSEPDPENPGKQKQIPIPYDPRAQERFARFATDLAFAVTPLPAGLSSTAGDAGLDASLSLEFAFIHPTQKFSDGTESFVWPTAKSPSNTLLIPTLHLRKGLPFSLQVGADVGYVTQVSLVVPTIWAQWGLVEGHKWIPDIHVRGLGTVVLGVNDLVMVVAGWDVGASYRIPIAGRAVIGVYAGYQQLGLSASTQNINFAPNHPSTSELTSDYPFNSLSYGSPIVPTTRLWRTYFGVQAHMSIAVVGLDFAYGSADNAIGDGLTTHYQLSSWKMGVRAGVLF